MGKQMYEIRYLLGAIQDIAEITRYIAHELCNPSAANKLVAAMLEAADRLALFPYINPVHITSGNVNPEYRKQIVRNYIMFYRVSEEDKKVMIVRIIYAHRDYDRLL